MLDSFDSRNQYKKAQHMRYIENFEDSSPEIQELGTSNNYRPKTGDISRGKKGSITKLKTQLLTTSKSNSHNQFEKMTTAEKSKKSLSKLQFSQFQNARNDKNFEKSKFDVISNSSEPSNRLSKSFDLMNSSLQIGQDYLQSKIQEIQNRQEVPKVDFTDEEKLKRDIDLF